MGNTQSSHKGKLQGELAPIPFDDFGEAHMTGDFLNQHQWVCRAAQGSEVLHSEPHAWCDGDQSHLSLGQASNFGDNFSGLHAATATQPTVLNTLLLTPTGGHEQPVTASGYLSIKRGATSSDSYELTTQAQLSMNHEYASTTDCLLQNLTMTIGDPSAHCYANALWRAFTWTCALLQETSTQPWGALQEAVQESLDTAEPVDLHQLPGMQSLGLNVTSTCRVMQIISSTPYGCNLKPEHSTTDMLKSERTAT